MPASSKVLLDTNIVIALFSGDDRARRGIEAGDGINFVDPFGLCPRIAGTEAPYG